MNIVPVLLVMNEEVWIKRILTALTHVFPHVIVSDTGSTDATVIEILQVPNVKLFDFESLSSRSASSLSKALIDSFRFGSDVGTTAATSAAAFGLVGLSISA